MGVVGGDDSLDLGGRLRRSLWDETALPKMA